MAIGIKDDFCKICQGGLEDWRKLIGNGYRPATFE